MNSTMKELIEVLKYLHEQLYWSGPLGARQVYFYNKCVTTGKILESIKDQSEYKRNMKRLNKMIELSEIEDHDYLIRARKLYREYYSEINLDIDIPEEIEYIMFEVKRELQRFHSFCDNQNSYDNMISIIKIFNRLKAKKQDLKLNGEFSQENTRFDLIEKDLKYQVCKDLMPIRFLL